MKILYKFTSRSRPEKFFKVLDNIAINSRIDNYHILITLDTDDTTMNNDDIRERIARYPNTYPIYGESKSKIDAINRDMVFAPDDWDILINLSDDMLFIEQGFDEIIVKDMQEAFPDMDGFLHYNDGNQRDNVSTMSIMTKKYYDRFGYIYHPDYVSVECDVEATEVAHILGRHKYMGDDKVIFRHFHPAWGLAERDAQYNKWEAPHYYQNDGVVLLKRRTNWYAITPEQRVNQYYYNR